MAKIYSVQKVNGQFANEEGEVTISLGSETTETLGALINASGDATPNDNDFVATALNGGASKKITWTNVKAFLKSYYDNIYTTSSAVASQISTALSGYATQSWVNSQGFITNVIASLGFTPENVANKQTDLTTSSTKYPTVNAVNVGLALKQNIGITVEKISGTKTLSNADNGKLFILTASTVVTIPNGLVREFNVTFRTLTGATYSQSLGNLVSILDVNGVTMVEKSSFTMVNTDVANEYLYTGKINI